MGCAGAACPFPLPPLPAVVSWDAAPAAAGPAAPLRPASSASSCAQRSHTLLSSPSLKALPAADPSLPPLSSPITRMLCRYEASTST